MGTNVEFKNENAIGNSDDVIGSCISARTTALEKIGEVTIHCWADEGGKYLHNGDCFESMLLEELNKNIKYSDFLDKTKEK